MKTSAVAAVSDRRLLESVISAIRDRRYSTQGRKCGRRRLVGPGRGPRAPRDRLFQPRRTKCTVSWGPRRLIGAGSERSKFLKSEPAATPQSPGVRELAPPGGTTYARRRTQTCIMLWQPMLEAIRVAYLLNESKKRTQDTNPQIQRWIRVKKGTIWRSKTNLNEPEFRGKKRPKSRNEPNELKKRTRVMTLRGVENGALLQGVAGGVVHTTKRTQNCNTMIVCVLQRKNVRYSQASLKKRTQNANTQIQIRIGVKKG